MFFILRKLYKKTRILFKNTITIILKTIKVLYRYKIRS